MNRSRRILFVSALCCAISAVLLIGCHKMGDPVAAPSQDQVKLAVWAATKLVTCCSPRA